MRELATQLGYVKLTDSIRSIVKDLLDKGEAELLYPNSSYFNPNQKIKIKNKS